MVWGWPTLASDMPGAKGNWHQQFDQLIAQHNYGLLLLATSLFISFAASLYLFKANRRLAENDRKLSELAHIDSLTSVLRRSRLTQICQQQIRENPQRPMTMVLVDLDNFKEINDTWGLQVGDRFLQIVAQSLIEGAGPDDYVARVGGDEFGWIVNGDVTDKQCEQVSQEINTRLADAVIAMGADVELTASVGLAHYPKHAKCYDDLFRCANQAKIEAKNLGRNQHVVYSPELQDKALQRAEAINDLNQAVSRQQFIAHYQPIIRLSNNLICKAEALVRWQHPQKGLIAPVNFIPLAEETGQIREIGNFITLQAVKAVTNWRNTLKSDFQVSVNVSPVQIRDSDACFNGLLTILANKHLPGDAINMEITESILMEDNDEIKRRLLSFRDADIQVSIDDFGTGYSSLSYLKRFDIDFLKIDRSFVDNLREGSSEFILCETMIMMAHKLGIKVVAEGIETAEQARILTQIGCDYGQGYYYSKPLPEDEFCQFVAEHNSRVLAGA